MIGHLKLKKDVLQAARLSDVLNKVGNIDHEGMRVFIIWKGLNLVTNGTSKGCKGSRKVQNALLVIFIFTVTRICKYRKSIKKNDTVCQGMSICNGEYNCLSRKENDIRSTIDSYAHLKGGSFRKRDGGVVKIIRSRDGSGARCVRDLFRHRDTRSTSDGKVAKDHERRHCDRSLGEGN